MTFEALAFYTGLFGSLHCVAMCGPLMLALPFSDQSIWISIAQRLVYQLGRILMYGALGLFMGLIGTGFGFLGLQQSLSLVTGTLLVIAGLNHFVKRKNSKTSLLQNRILPHLTSLLAKYLSKPYGSFVAGALNGILPCGVTYIALAQAINLNNTLDAGKSMLFFGLGTLPLLFITTLAPLFFRRFKAPAILVPVLFLIAGSFLMARGLNFEIPYISHAIHLDRPIICE